jgi:hypothetical protein
MLQIEWQVPKQIVLFTFYFFPPKVPEFWIENYLWNFVLAKLGKKLKGHGTWAIFNGILKVI